MLGTCSDRTSIEKGQEVPCGRGDAEWGKLCGRHGERRPRAQAGRPHAHAHTHAHEYAVETPAAPINPTRARRRARARDLLPLQVTTRLPRGFREEDLEEFFPRAGVVDALQETEADADWSCYGRPSSLHARRTVGCTWSTFSFSTGPTSRTAATPGSTGTSGPAGSLAGSAGKATHGQPTLRSQLPEGHPRGRGHEAAPGGSGPRNAARAGEQ